MNNSKPTLLEVIEAIKTECYTPYDAENLTISYEGNKVEFEGEIWYEITVADGTGSYTAWNSILDGGYAVYDGDRIDPADRIPAIDAILAKREEDEED